jgi:hypothetical protein
VSDVRQRVAAGMAKHVSMDLEIKAGALPKPLNVPVNRVRREWSVLLSLKHEA